MYWRRPWRVPWTSRRCNQSILKEISPKYSLEGLMLMLKLQYFGHQMQRTESFVKTLMLWKIEGRRREWQRMRWLDGITIQWTWVWVSSRSWWWTGKPSVLHPWGCKESGRIERLIWTELNVSHILEFLILIKFNLLLFFMNLAFEVESKIH